MARHELWVKLADRPGNLAALAGDLAACDANIVHLDVHAGGDDTVIDRLVVQVPDGREGDLAAVAGRFGASLRAVGDDRARGDAHVARPQFGGDRDADRDRRPPAGPGGRERGLGSTAPDPHQARRPPTTLERLVALPDGGLVRLRHLGPGDRAELHAHHERCSEATRRHSRFLVPGALPQPPGAGGTTDERCHRVALAALVGGDIVGVARLEREGGSVATAAVIVEDGHQRRGIGTLLIGELALLATGAECRCLRALAPGGTEGLRRALTRAGLGFTVRRIGDQTVLDCGLAVGASIPA
jgi:GNAT superfamily N-acetyltransferase